MSEKKDSRYKPSKNLHVRTVGFPHDLYARIEELARQEDRDVTAQIVRMLRQALEKMEKSSGNTKPATGIA